MANTSHEKESAGGHLGETWRDDERASNLNDDRLSWRDAEESGRDRRSTPRGNDGRSMRDDYDDENDGWPRGR